MHIDSTLYPFGHHYAQINGHRMHFLDEGEGNPIVMVHGNPTWSFFFRGLVTQFRAQNRCIVPDHIGCGFSDKPALSAYEYSLKNRVDDLEALLNHLEITQNITLIVHDWGGMIGMAYATRHPERIARIVVMNTAGFTLPPTKRFPFGLWLGRNTALGAWLITQHNAFVRIAAKVCVKRAPLPENVKAAYLAPYDSPANRAAVLRFVQDIPLKPSDTSFAMVHEVEEKGPSLFAQTPMLVCWGLRDFVFSHHFLTQWEKLYPHAQVHRFEDAGHYLLEDAGQEVKALIGDFIAKPQGKA